MAKCNCEHLKQLDQVVSAYAGKKGGLVPVLQKVQEIYGYLPRQVMVRVAAGLDLPLSQVYGVATFYAQFHLKPRGKNIIRVCQGTACHVRGAGEILERVKAELGVEAGETTEDRRFTLEPVACIGACGLAPVMMINDETHGRLTPERIPQLLDNYR